MKSKASPYIPPERKVVERQLILWSVDPIALMVIVNKSIPKSIKTDKQKRPYLIA